MTVRTAHLRSLALALVALAGVAVALVLPQSAGARPPASVAAVPARAYPADSPAQLALARQHIKHVVLIVMENHTFDSMFGTYPGVRTRCPATTPTGSRRRRCAAAASSTSSGPPTSPRMSTTRSWAA